MEKRKVAIDLVKANWFAVAILVISAVVYLIPFVAIWGFNLPKEDSGFEGLLNSLMVFLVLALGIVVHELIHGITFACFAKRGFKSISFGIIMKYLTPYCHCDEPMSRGKYAVAALMPLVVLGFMPAVLSWFTGSWGMLAFAVILTSGAAGDIWMTWLVSKEKPGALIEDLETEAGYYVYDGE